MELFSRERCRSDGGRSGGIVCNLLLHKLSCIKFFMFEKGFSLNTESSSKLLQRSSVVMLSNPSNAFAGNREMLLKPRRSLSRELGRGNGNSSNSLCCK